MREVTSRTFDLGGGRGDRIEWLRVPPSGPGPCSGLVVGWKTPRPRPGDILRVPMQSGRIAHFGFATLEPMPDPPDMFFANVVILGYEDELRR